ncbi:MAG TPA: SGNH/GDSL hydrolase family protein [Edaphobacter sp.]|nr:SGNH/GDSL hydrolase family protein [Edaphobacter sp.]
MNLRTRTLPLLALLLLSLCAFNGRTAFAAQPDHWVGTWATAPVALPNPDGKFGTADTTYREIVHVSLGGSSVRIVLSNEFGLDPLTIGAAHIALSSGGATGNGEIGLTAANDLTFDGRPSVTIPPGALVVSDPADLKLPAFADLAVSLFVPLQPMRQVSIHNFGDQTSYAVEGNAVSVKTLEAPKEIFSWPFLKGIDVKASDKSASIVTFGDSITDGALSTRNANARWPDLLARRLQANKKTSQLGVLNEGIGGNRVLHDNTGPSALARFDRDVIAQAGVKYVVFMESINDIGHATDPTKPYDVITAADLIFGFSQLAERAHTHGIKVIGATLTPFVGAKYQSADGEAMRQAVNQWIRTSNQLDGVIDFDKATQDPANPTVFLPANDSGDHLHPKDAGYKAMGESIDLKLFTK